MEAGRSSGTEAEKRQSRRGLEVGRRRGAVEAKQRWNRGRLEAEGYSDKRERGREQLRDLAEERFGLHLDLRG